MPTMREVVTKLVINPNTVFKAYRMLEHEGFVTSRPGLGTFVAQTFVETPARDYQAFRQGLTNWLNEAYAAGLDEESIQALFESTFQQFLRRNHDEGIA